jgi:hypothetical protein
MSADANRRCRVRLDNPDRIRRRAAAVIRDGLVGARPPAEVRDLVAALQVLGSMLEPVPTNGEGSR